MTDQLTVERKQGVGYLTLNRPPVNAFTHELLGSLGDALMELANDPSISVAVIRSGIPRYFSAGMDLNVVGGVGSAGVNMPDDTTKKFRDMNWVILDCPLPLIAAVGGFAVGMGFMLPALCDIVVASKSASFGMPEVRFALGGGATMSRILPPAMLRYVMLTGKRLSAESLAQAGAIAAVVDDYKLDSEVERIASEMAAEIHPHLLRNLKLSLEQLKDVSDIRYRYALEHAWGGLVRADLGDAASSDDWLKRLKSK